MVNQKWLRPTVAHPFRGEGFFLLPLTAAGAQIYPPRVTEHESPFPSSRNQEVLCERPLRVDPLPVAPESRTRRHL
jgi:hypothetical protein